MNNKFKIFTPFYNVENWISNNIKSTKYQSYTNFNHILIDDLSTDNSYKIAVENIADNNKYKIIKNETKKYALQNFYEQIKNENLDDEDIIVILDGDDWLASKDALKILNQHYNKTNCLMTYGSYIEYPSNNKGYFSKKIPQDIIKNNAFREAEWMTSHLRSFKYKVWKNIKEEDLKDSNNNFYKMTCDLAMMFPMLEMCGERSSYVKEILYVYNMSNPLNDYKIDNFMQILLEKEIRTKKKYSKIFI